MSRIQEEQKIHKHRKLMNDYNDLQIRIKAHILDWNELNGDEYDKFMAKHPKPTCEELNEMSNRIMAALQEDSEYMRKKYIEFCDCEHPRDPYNGTGICMSCNKQFGLKAALKFGYLTIF